MKGMASMDVATALAGSPVQARGAQQGGRTRAQQGASDGGGFGSVLSDAVSQEAASPAAPAAPKGSTPAASGDAGRSKHQADTPAQDAAAAADSAAAAPGVLAASAQFAAAIQPVQPVAATGDIPAAQAVAGASAAATPPVNGALPAESQTTAASGLMDPRLVNVAGTAAVPATNNGPAAAPSPASVPGATAVRQEPAGSTPSSLGAAPQRGATLPGSAVSATALPGIAVAAAAAPGAARSAGAPAGGGLAAGTASAQAVAADPTAAAAPAAPADPAPAVSPATHQAAAPTTVPATLPTTATPTPAVPNATATAALGLAGVVGGAGKLPNRDSDAPAPGLPAATDLVAAAGAAGATAVAQPAPGAARPTVTAAPVPAQQPALQPQLAKPLFTLAGAPHGQHIMTLKVTPEDLGPLTVRAHIDGAGVRIELFAPGDTGREALRGILPELRKELADSGFGATLDLSDHSGPAGGGQGQDGAGREAAHAGSGAGSGAGAGGRNGPGEPRPGHRWDALADQASLRTARLQNGPQTTLDILV